MRRGRVYFGMKFEVHIPHASEVLSLKMRSFYACFLQANKESYTRKQFINTNVGIANSSQLLHSRSKRSKKLAWETSWGIQKQYEFEKEKELYEHK